MKLPWDKNYLKIALHVVLAAAAIYITVLLIDSAAFVLTNMKNILDSVSSFISGLLSVFSVVVIAFVIAYLLDPAVDFFQKHYTRFMEKRLRPFLQRQFNKIPMYRKLRGEPKPKVRPQFAKRTAGALLAYLAIAVVLSVVITLLVRYIGGGSMEGMGTAVIDGANKAYIQITELYAGLRVTLEEWGVAEDLSNMISDLVNMLRDFIRTIPDGIGSVATATGGMIGTSLIAIVVAFYLMRDKAYILARTKTIAVTFLPERLERRISGFLHEINEVFSGYIRGRLTDSLIMSALLSIGLSVIGVPFAIPIGIFSGLANIIPYFGGIMAFVISVFSALLAGNPTLAFWAALVVFALQQIDSMFIEPRVVGQKVELSPALVMIALAVGGNLFGVTGMVFAVPVFAIFKIFISRYVKRAARMRELERGGPV